jgi:hypothetical protein
VPIDDVFNALAGTLGTYYVNDFNKYGRTWQVLMSAEPAFRKRPDDITGVYVRSKTTGDMMPLSSLVTVRYSSGPDTLDRFNNLPAVKILGEGAHGISSGQAIARVEQIAREVLPPDFSYDWGGTSYQEKRSSGAAGISLALAVVMVFLILSAQYERWSLPLSVLLALPFGTFGALAAVWLRGMSNDVYFQIGPRHAARPRREKRDPDRRIRAAQARGRDVGVGRSGGSRAAAVPADPDDVARFHPRRAAARDLHRRRRRRPGVGGHWRDGRHARGDVPGCVLRAVVLPADLRAQDHRIAQQGRDPSRNRPRQDRARARASPVESRPPC